ncbi:MAG: sulfoxide reductase heme-binding subunit YedZ [Candidatus Marinimicrobia bacterium]|nr:sulfoxide reductase heme-binding subunit YedZ [Candidatus Neomarinimicrobiota bacterium]
MIARARWLVHPLALLPLALLFYDFLIDNLTANPIQEITQRTGKTALVLLILTLVVTPVNRHFRLPDLVPLRKRLGLYAFLYATLHLSIFVGLDYFFDWELILLELSEKLYVLVGLTAWLLLLPLAVTSTKGWQRRLGKRWKGLHRLIYVAASAVILHYLWLVKSDIREPLAYGAGVALLLTLRLPPVRRWLPRRTPE